jgi:hypothetical protein
MKVQQKSLSVAQEAIYRLASEIWHDFVGCDPSKAPLQDDQNSLMQSRSFHWLTYPIPTWPSFQPGSLMHTRFSFEVALVNSRMLAI